MSLLEAPYLIEAPTNGYASFHKRVAPHKIEAPSTSNKNLMESMHKYIIQAWHMLLKITMAATTTYFTGVGLHKLSCVNKHTISAPMTHKWHRIEAPLVVS